MICLCFDSHFNTPSKTLPLRRARQLGAPDSCWRPWECHFPGSRYSREAGRPWWSLLYHHGGEDLGDISKWYGDIWILNIFSYFYHGTILSGIRHVNTKWRRHNYIRPKWHQIRDMWSNFRVFSVKIIFG